MSADNFSRRKLLEDKKRPGTGRATTRKTLLDESVHHEYQQLQQRQQRQATVADEHDTTTDEVAKNLVAGIGRRTNRVVDLDDDNEELYFATIIDRNRKDNGANESILKYLNNPNLDETSTNITRDSLSTTNLFNNNNSNNTIMYRQQVYVPQSQDYDGSDNNKSEDDNGDDQQQQQQQMVIPGTPPEQLYGNNSNNSNDRSGRTVVSMELANSNILEQDNRQRNQRTSNINNRKRRDTINELDVSAIFNYNNNEQQQQQQQEEEQPINYGDEEQVDEKSTSEILVNSRLHHHQHDHDDLEAELDNANQILGRKKSLSSLNSNNSNNSNSKNKNNNSNNNKNNTAQPRVSMGIYNVDDEVAITTQFDNNNDDYNQMSYGGGFEADEFNDGIMYDDGPNVTPPSNNSNKNNKKNKQQQQQHDNNDDDDDNNVQGTRASKASRKRKSRQEDDNDEDNDNYKKFNLVDDDEEEEEDESAAPVSAKNKKSNKNGKQPQTTSTSTNNNNNNNNNKRRRKRYNLDDDNNDNNDNDNQDHDDKNNNDDDNNESIINNSTQSPFHKIPARKRQPNYKEPHQAEDDEDNNDKTFVLSDNEDDDNDRGKGGRSRRTSSSSSSSNDDSALEAHTYKMNRNDISVISKQHNILRQRPQRVRQKPTEWWRNERVDRNNPLIVRRPKTPIVNRKTRPVTSNSSNSNNNNNNEDGNATTAAAATTQRQQHHHHVPTLVEKNNGMFKVLTRDGNEVEMEVAKTREMMEEEFFKAQADDNDSSNNGNDNNTTDKPSTNHVDMSVSTGISSYKMWRCGVIKICPQGKKPAQSPANFAQVFYLVAGSAHITITNSEFKLTPGSFFFVPPFNSFEVYNPSERVECKLAYFTATWDAKEMQEGINALQQQQQFEHDNRGGAAAADDDDK